MPHPNQARVLADLAAKVRRSGTRNQRAEFAEQIVEVALGAVLARYIALPPFGYPVVSCLTVDVAAIE